MAARLTESEIETLAIERLQALGFDYIYGPDIAPDSANPERESFAEVLLLSRLRKIVARIKAIFNGPDYQFSEFVKINNVGGYGSIFGDGSNISIDICQYCLKDKLGEWMRIKSSESSAL